MTDQTCCRCPRELKEGDRVLYVEPHEIVVWVSARDAAETLGSEYRQDLPEPGTGWICWACAVECKLVDGVADAQGN